MGVTLIAGAGLGQGGVLTRSLRAIADQPGDDMKADRCFDVFFEVDLGGGIFVYHHDALRIAVGLEGFICLPPEADILASRPL